MCEVQISKAGSRPPPFSLSLDRPEAFTNTDSVPAHCARHISFCRNNQASAIVTIS